MKHIILIMGYGQKLNHHTGLKIITHNIFKKYGYPKNRIKLYEWNVDTNQLAKRIGAWEGNLMVVGYSYGGFTSVLLTRKLSKKNIKIKNLCLIDPVWRSKEYRAGFKSLNKNKKIIVPNNVENIYTWQQRKGIIQGHDIIAQPQTTHYSKTLNTRHYKIDRDQNIHNKIYDLYSVL